MTDHGHDSLSVLGVPINSPAMTGESHVTERVSIPLGRLGRMEHYESESTVLWASICALCQIISLRHSDEGQGWTSLVRHLKRKHEVEGIPE